MPTAKRERQRAGRQARQEALEKARKRRTTVRRGATLVVVLALFLGVYSLVHHHSSSPPAAPDSQARLNQLAVVAGCPSNPASIVNHDRWNTPPAMTIDPAKTYTATVVTDIGTMKIALDAGATPKTVNDFVFLADHDYYNCVTFHRVIPTFMDQTGDPTGTGTGGATPTSKGQPGYDIPDELPAKAANPDQQYPIGSVAMANTGAPNTGGSQFFIVTGPEGESLPNTYALFGTVTSGLSVAQKINSDGTSSGKPKVTHRMLRVTISTS